MRKNQPNIGRASISRYSWVRKTGKRTLVSTDLGGIKEHFEKTKLEQVTQSYASNKLTVSWQGPENESYHVKVVDEQNKSDKLDSATTNRTTSCDFNTDDLSSSNEGINVISTVCKMIDGEPSTDYVYAESSNYCLGQAVIDTLTYESNTDRITGAWTRPVPLDHKNPNEHAIGYDYKILDPSGNAIDGHENDPLENNVSISTEKLGLTPGITYRLQIRATGQQKVDPKIIPGAWSELKNFVVGEPVPKNVTQSYDSESGILTTCWNALEGKSYNVVVNDQSGSVSQVKNITDTPAGTERYPFNIITDLDQSNEGGYLISAVCTVNSDPDLNSPYVNASPPIYRLGQAVIETLIYNDSTSELTGKWNIPNPGNGAPPVSGYNYQILDPSDNDKVTSKGHKNDNSGNISISTEGLGLTSGTTYQVQISATGGDDVVPGELSASQSFTVKPVYQFPPVSSNINNAPSGSVGYFLIGDEEATVGSNVTFWGSNWSDKNSLSGGIDSSVSSLCGYLFANELVPGESSCQGAYPADLNSGVALTVGNTYSMPVVSTLIKGTDAGLSDHFTGVSGNVTMIVNVQIGCFQDDRTKPDEGTGTIVSILWDGSDQES